MEVQSEPISLPVKLDVLALRHVAALSPPKSDKNSRRLRILGLIFQSAVPRSRCT
jgi:hypothetical protein